MSKELEVIELDDREWSQRGVGQEFDSTFPIFPSPAGMSLTKLSRRE